MSNKLNKKKSLTSLKNNATTKGSVFIVEKDGKAYFKDKKLAIICKGAKIIKDSKYSNYFWEYDYMANLQWFKKMVALMMANGGNIRFVGMTADEFNQLGGTSIGFDDAKVIDVKAIQRLMK